MPATGSLPALLIRDADAITGPWLSEVLRRKGLSIVGIRQIGTGQMSRTYRVTYTHAETTGTVVVKLASDDPTSRGTGVGLGAYFREVAFYQRLSGRIKGPIPQCYLAEYDPSEGWFTLVNRSVVDDDVGHTKCVDDRSEGPLDAGPVDNVGFGAVGVHPELRELGQARVDHVLALGQERD